jgi:hypothetical protein
VSELIWTQPANEYKNLINNQIFTFIAKLYLPLTNFLKACKLFIDGYNANLLNTKMEYNLKHLMLIMSSQVPKKYAFRRNSFTSC